MSLYRTSVNKPVTIALIFITVAILGVFSLTRLSTNLFPDMGENTILVVTSYSGASAADIETNVTKPLENALNSVSNLKHLSSTSKENISVISLEFEYGIDINEATNDVRDKLDMVTQALPDAVSIPTIFKFSMEDMPIMLMSATADESLSGLDKILDDKVATPLARVNGVGTISVSGAPKREIQVYVDPDKLAAYGITVESISSTLAYENRNTPAGTIDIGSNTYSVRVEKEFKSAEEMLDVIVGTSNTGAPVYLRDVAKVNDGEQERLQKVYSNGQQGAMITIQKQTDANSNRINQHCIGNGGHLLCKYLKVGLCDGDEHTQHEADEEQQTQFPLLRQAGADVGSHGGHGQVRAHAEQADAQHQQYRAGGECDELHRGKVKPGGQGHQIDQHRDGQSGVQSLQNLVFEFFQFHHLSI